MENDSSQTVTPDSSTATPDVKTQAVTMEAFDALQSKLANDMRAQFGRIQQQITEALKTAKPEPSAPAVPTPATSEAGKNNDVMRQVQELNERLKASEARAEKIKSAAIRSSVHESLVSGGADPDLANIAVDNILTRFGNSISAKEDDLGGYVIGINDGLDVKPIKEWAGAYLQTDVGKKIVAPKRNPDVRLPNGATPGGDVIRISRSEASKLDSKTLQSGRVVFID